MNYNVLQYLDRDVCLFPDKLAVADEKMELTYSQYQKAAKQVASYILSEIPGTMNQPVAVLIDRNILSLVAFMGVVYSGNFYVPVDVTMPEERITLIYETLQPAMIIDARGAANVREGAVDVRELMSEGRPVDEDAIALVRRNAISTDPLYAIFTSGSTGVPKSVVVTHGGVIDLVEAFADSFGFDQNLVFGNQAPFDFDVSVKDIYNAMRNGGTVQVIPKKFFMMPKLLISYLIDKKVNTLIWAVSAMRIVSDFKTMDATDAPELRYVMFSGEIMPVRSLNYWIAHVPGARYVNLYGPTEITCNCTYYEIDRHFEDDEMLPVGRPFVNMRVDLLDEQQKPVKEIGKVGEICVSGVGLALGYWNNHERTDAAFTKNPQITAYDARMYHTGDMGYYDKDGNIVFASRRDFQIKHMGHRIELGEVEVALNAIPFLTISCCLYDTKAEKIVCFYQAEQECKKEIVKALSKKLPKYMWPNVYVHYEQLPTTKNGKIDRKKLGEQLGK